MATSRSTPSVASFDGFQIDLTTGDLRCGDGNVARIQQLPLQMLRLLLAAEGKAVTREELRQTLWPDQNFVDSEHGINTAVRKLRQALGDSVDDPRFIETIPKVGYRFLQSVEWSFDAAGEPAHDGPTEAPADRPGAPALPRRFAPRRIVIPAAIVATVVLILVFAYFKSYRNAVHRKDADSTASPREQRLTTNPEDTPVTSGLISPDGKYLA